ncbi:copper homeostasis protein CutC [Thermosediminibacter oceani]|uniref:PF03932 family protein CutC n=1 Tax=Thermosediminibacter oceani (strain ATCC BAA-1034 / DSM 16646 / JW/IW-1228P) TaxID=555079 RepID=D9S0C3_THEOJ|nr:copper homeostasis protein CutC [Thermosediminibacter oceani]ADL07051.1 CutC family protein [Thermosediminibacter oceani DSM 16646]
MIEVIAMTPEDAKRIEACGADRIELVSALTEGGLTPSYAMIDKVVKSVRIPVNVMIRPHSKSFIYTREEIEIMKEDIRIAKELGANGVVIGALNEKKEIHEGFIEELLNLCDGLDVTFHRAIDELEDPINGIRILSRYTHIKTVLTSGGKGSIVENIPKIREMIKNSGHISVMVGGGLNFENIGRVVKETGVKVFHFGTAVRDNRSPFGEINEHSLKDIIKIVREEGDNL